MKRTLLIAAILGLLALDLLGLYALYALPRMPQDSLINPEKVSFRWTITAPLKAVLDPESAADRRLRNDWLLFQVVPLSLLAALLVTYGPGERGGLRWKNDGTHGTARWRTPKELLLTFRKVLLTERDPLPAGTVMGATKTRGHVEAYVAPYGRSPGEVDLNPHVMVLGASGAGKTRRGLMPIIYYHARTRSHSLVISDCKGELYAKSARLLQKAGYEVRTLNLTDMEYSDRYNPMVPVIRAFEMGKPGRAAQEARLLASAIIASTGGSGHGDSFWAQAEESLLLALILLIADLAPPASKSLSNAAYMLAEYGANGGEALDAIMTGLPPEHPARSAYNTVRLSQDKTRAGILAGTANRLALFTDPTIAAMTGGSDYAFADLGRRPIALFMVLPETTTAWQSLSSLFLTQLYNELVEDAKRRPGGRLERPVCFLLDEFCNIGKLPDWDAKVSTMRGYGLSAIHVIQSIEQLRGVYREKAMTILANCDTRVVLKVNDSETATYISGQTGRGTVATESRSQGDQGRGSVSEGSTGRALLTMDEVLRWDNRTQGAIVLQGGLYPATLPLLDMSEWPESQSYVELLTTDHVVADRVVPPFWPVLPDQDRSSEGPGKDRPPLRPAGRTENRLTDDI